MYSYLQNIYWPSSCINWPQTIRFTETQTYTDSKRDTFWTMISKFVTFFVLVDLNHADTTLANVCLNGLTMDSSGSPYYVTQDVIIYYDFVIKNNVDIIFYDGSTIEIRHSLNGCNESNYESSTIGLSDESNKIQVTGDGRFNLRTDLTTSTYFCNTLFTNMTGMFEMEWQWGSITKFFIIMQTLGNLQYVQIVYLTILVQQIL